jgi:hypothetical protein
VGAATLPAGAWQVRGDRVLQPGVRVGGDQANPGEASRDKVGEERVPGRPRLAGGSLQTEHFAAPVRVDTGRDQHDDVHDLAALADLHSQRVSGDERERSRLGQRSVPEVRDLLVELGCHPGHLRLRQRVDPEGLHQFVHPTCADASEVAVRDDSDQRRLGAFAALQQPLGEVGALPQLRDRNIDRAHPGVEIAVTITIAVRDAVWTGSAPFGADHRVSVSREQGVDHPLQQLPHQVWRRLRERFREHSSRVDNVWSGHRDEPFEWVVGDSSKDHTVTAPTSSLTR